MTVTDWMIRHCRATEALRELRHVCDYMSETGAHKATNSIRRAIKSVDGARRHALGRYTRLTGGFPKVQS